MDWLEESGLREFSAEEIEVARFTEQRFTAQWLSGLKFHEPSL